ncbi:MAG: TAXI family TRAP transporter solute-binding subunit [Ruminococcaceae bacterium]|nr:TAXI family TRAP transporter solute-binding subunit [Oscillospiraceae bacterium]
MKKIVSILLATILVGTLFTACSTTGASSTAASSANQSVPSASSAVDPVSTSESISSYEKPKFLSVGTAGTGGAYYPIGIAMADIITNSLGIQTTAQVTGGAVENNGLIQDGTLEIAITQGPMAYAAVNGTAPYEKKQDKISAMFSGLSKGIFHVVTLESTGIRTMEDLKGRRVVMGPAGGGAINMASDIWGEYGFSINDVNATYISYSDGMSALTDGKCDAVVVQSAAPASAITELMVTRKDAVILEIEEAMRKQIIEKYPYYSEYVIPKDVYGTASDFPVIHLSNMVVCNSDLPEELVYDITKAFFAENVDKIKSSNPAAKDLNVESAVKNVPIPLHPGAEKYFREIGVIK